jgi:hypothetical protein
LRSRITSELRMLWKERAGAMVVNAEVAAKRQMMRRLRNAAFIVYCKVRKAKARVGSRERSALGVTLDNESCSGGMPLPGEGLSRERENDASTAAARAVIEAFRLTILVTVPGTRRGR